MTTAAHSLRALQDDGDFSAPTRVSWAHGRFALGGETQPTDLDGSDFWLIPGLVDTHLHAAWHAFDASDRVAMSTETVQRATADALARTLAAGVTSVRDAGGLDVATLELVPEAARPRVQLSVSLIDRAAAAAAGGVAAAADAALGSGARWVKLVATAGVAAPAGTDLEPVFSRAEIADAVRRASQVGGGVMVHAWGGRAVDDAIDAGAMSLEHAMYLTEAQATRAAEREMTLVPTLRIYHLVQRMIAEGALPTAFGPRVNEAVTEHGGAVRRARDAGLAIALGTDYGTTEQHGTNRREFDALVTAGLTPQEAVIASTRSGAALLARVARDPEAVPDGRIANGSVADGVLLRDDPRVPGALSDPGALVAVIKDGILVRDPLRNVRTRDHQPSHSPQTLNTREDHP